MRLMYVDNFSEKSSSWSNGGVAFLDLHPNHKCQTLGKMYLITKE
ncbi:hypothetical protein [Clostridium sp. DJ247]|nr:hypothetical protein [Clostridium sp. DJ247]